MQNPFNHPAWIDISLFFGRLTLGLYFAIAGFGKFQKYGLTGFVDGPFKSMQPSWLPDWFGRPYGYALPALELVCGVLLMLGLFTRIAGGLITLMLLSIVVALIVKNGISGQTADAGTPFHSAFVMLATALIIAVAGSGRLALDPLYFGAGGGGGGGKKSK
jgi:putative oxidoreductase